jgi:hypothetical protein
MDVNSILAELDAEISRLQQIRKTLGSMGEAKTQVKGKRGRPKGSKNAKKPAAVKSSTVASVAKTTKKRKLSPEGRKRIAEAMKRRWAAHRKATS